MFDGIRHVTAVHKAMRRLHRAVADQLGIEPLVDTNKSMKGEFFPAQEEYPLRGPEGSTFPATQDRCTTRPH